jgi:hypothetical protein
LYYEDGINFTNLYSTINSTSIHSTFYVLPFDNSLNFKLIKNSYEPINFEIKTEDEVVNQIYDILYQKIKKFLTHNQLPLRSFLTGGIDSMLVYSFVKKITENVKIVNYYYFYLDEFCCKNMDYIKKEYWGYKQIHHWEDPCVLLSGTPGDEFMLRSPTTSNLYLMNYNTSIPKLIENSKHLHSAYFKKEDHLAIFDQQCKDKFTQMLVKDKKFLYPKICEILLEDFQHWHLGKTITFTPLRDLEVFKLLLQLPFDSAVSQILDSKISKRLIAMNDPNLLNYLTCSKNKDSLYKIYDLYKPTMSAVDLQ